MATSRCRPILVPKSWSLATGQPKQEAATASSQRWCSTVGLPILLYQYWQAYYTTTTTTVPSSTASTVVGYRPSGSSATLYHRDTYCVVPSSSRPTHALDSYQLTIRKRQWHSLLLSDCFSVLLFAFLTLAIVVNHFYIRFISKEHWQTNRYSNT